MNGGRKEVYFDSDSEDEWREEGVYFDSDYEDEWREEGSFLRLILRMNEGRKEVSSDSVSKDECSMEGPPPPFSFLTASSDTVWLKTFTSNQSQSPKARW